MDNFEKFLAGAHAVDVLFYHADYSQNMPVILGLLAYGIETFNTTSEAIIPYDNYLKIFLAHLQQLDMEVMANRSLNGEPVPCKAGHAIWGIGAYAASFHQLLHQGQILFLLISLLLYTA